MKPGTVHTLMGKNSAGQVHLDEVYDGIYHVDERQRLFMKEQEVPDQGTSGCLNRGIYDDCTRIGPIPERSIGENISSGATQPNTDPSPSQPTKGTEDAAKVLKSI